MCDLGSCLFLFLIFLILGSSFGLPVAARFFSCLNQDERDAQD